MKLKGLYNYIFFYKDNELEKYENEEIMEDDNNIDNDEIFESITESESESEEELISINESESEEAEEEFAFITESESEEESTFEHISNYILHNSEQIE